MRHRHPMHHHRGSRIAMRRLVRRGYRGRGGPLGGPGRGAMMRGFLAENPECAEKLARYGVVSLREDGFTDDEIRDHFDHLHDHGLGEDLDIDELLGR